MEISTAADFAKKAEERRTAKAETLTLPSGLVILAQRPSPEWWMRNVGRLPQSIALQLGGPVNPDREHTVAELTELSSWIVMMISEVVVSPVVRLNPGPGELDPHLIDDVDANFIIRFAGGEIAADGQSLDTFSGKRGTDARAGSHGTGVEL